MGFGRKTTYYSTPVWEFNLPTGWSCPFAKECLVKVDRSSGKQVNSSNAYKCYAAGAERFPGVRESRWNNFEQAKLGVLPDLPKRANAVRIHSSGDFFSQAYFDLWLDYVRKYPETTFWAFTKSVRYWVKRLDVMPSNLIMTASVGGGEDHLIEQYNLRYAIVVPTPEKALELGLPIDDNDDHARVDNGSFALVDNNA